MTTDERPTDRDPLEQIVVDLREKASAPQDSPEHLFRDAVRHVLGIDDPNDVAIDPDGSMWMAWESTPFRFFFREKYCTVVIAEAVLSENTEISAELLAELNLINGGVVGARIFYDDGWIVVRQEIPLRDITYESVRYMAWAVGSLAAWAAPEITDGFGGDLYTNAAALAFPVEQ